MPRSPKIPNTQARAQPPNSRPLKKSTPKTSPAKPSKSTPPILPFREKERVADDESARPLLASDLPALERVAAVHLDIRARHWSQHRKAEAAGVSLAEWRAIMADPLLIPTLEEAWRQLLLGAVAPAIRGAIESSILVGREGATDRAAILRMAGLIQAPGRRGGQEPASAPLQASAVAARLDAVRAGRVGLPAPGMDSTMSPEPEAIDADYVEEPSGEDAGDTSEFV